jgi:formate hydrogenlyase subunit 3/multisubunit Na+/H+ antiporter MnhD subunit
MTEPSEPRNWFFTLLIPASVLFIITALALAIIPVLEEKAAQAGMEAPPSEFRTALRADGWKWLLVQLAAVVGLSLAAMLWDRIRQPKSSSRLKSDEQATP